MSRMLMTALVSSYSGSCIHRPELLFWAKLQRLKKTNAWGKTGKSSVAEKINETTMKNDRAVVCPMLVDLRTLFTYSSQHNATSARSKLKTCEVVLTRKHSEFWEIELAPGFAHTALQRTPKKVHL